jgi:S-adenosylmethionine:tRNA ribosyltransferase-isomerase
MESRLFEYRLLPEMIAQAPSMNRSSCRLINVAADGSLEDRHFYDLPLMLNSKDLLVLNNTRVLSARITAYKKSGGGRADILIERQTGPYNCVAQIRASNNPKVGSCLVTAKGSQFVVEDRVNQFYDLSLTSQGVLQEVLEKEGQVPLPPYIRRQPLWSDQQNYQTVYATEPGAVAAPTAGLHFDENLFLELKNRKVQIEFVTLHIGSGSFQPIRTQNIEDHEMHSEWISVPEHAVRAINKTRKEGGRVVAVGTTVVRALESAVQNGEIVPTEGYTSLYIVPGFNFQIVDVLITNFHQPKSSLFVLVSAFFGLEAIRQVYSHAISNGYRFYSYGDAMRLVRRNS